MNEQNLTIARAVGATAAGVRRRTIVRGVAWTLPAISLVTAAPAFATSSECTYTIDFSANASSASWTPLTHLSGTSPTGDVVTVGLQSTPASCTQTTYFNMTSMSNAALAGVSNYGADPACSEEQQPTGAPLGWLVLNQHAALENCRRSACDDHPTQDLTLTFVDSVGGPIRGISHLELTVYDITSVTRREAPGTPYGMAPEEYWTSRYVDTVGFSQTPSRIIAFDAAASGLSTSAYAGTGQGSYADPYRRTGEQAPTVPGVSIKDVVVFDALPGNTITLRYSNLYYGYQFVALAGIRFQAPCA